MKYGLSPFNEDSNGASHSTMEDLKSNMKINLPVINDENDEDLKENTEDSEINDIKKNEKNHLAASTNNLKEVMDLSPIYENSSDACSSHGDLRDNTEKDLQKNFKVPNSDFNESENSTTPMICKVLNSDNNESSPTPISISQTQSENNSEMGNDSLKNSMKNKKKVNIAPVFDPDNTLNDVTTLRLESECSISPICSLTDNSKDGYLTMIGTVKRGRNKGQNIAVKLNMSREEFEFIEATIIAEKYNKMNFSKCSLFHGVHIFLFSLMCLPFVFCISAGYSFYVGSKTCDNIINYITGDKSFIKRHFLPPIIVILYLFLILIFMIGLGLYSGIVQVTASGTTWYKDVCDFEKGFYGWFCNKIGLPDCCPYKVVILTDQTLSQLK